MARIRSLESSPGWRTGPPGVTCEDCAWRYLGGPGPPVDRCRRHGGARLGPAVGCASHTPRLDCAACGACCREAYDTVELGAREPLVRLHPALVQVRDGRRHLDRDGAGLCPLLERRDGAWRCRDHTHRPRSCAELEPGGHGCLFARRRLGLTP